MRKIDCTSRATISVVIGIFCCSATALLYFAPPATSHYLGEEHGPIENISALFYLAGMALCLIAIAKGRGRYFAWIWVVLCFLFFGEETNWLQNYFQYDTPFYEQLDATEKNEFALHNFSILEGEGKDFNRKDGSFSLAPENFLKAQTLFKFGFFIYFFLFPLIMLRSKVGAFFRRMGVPPFELVNLIVVWTAVGVISLVSIWNVRFGVEHDVPFGELREMFYSIFIFYHITGFFTIPSTDTVSAVDVSEPVAA